MVIFFCMDSKHGERWPEAENGVDLSPHPRTTSSLRPQLCAQHPRLSEALAITGLLKRASHLDAVGRALCSFSGACLTRTLSLCRWILTYVKSLTERHHPLACPTHQPPPFDYIKTSTPNTLPPHNIFRTMKFSPPSSMAQSDSPRSSLARCDSVWLCHQKVPRLDSTQPRSPSAAHVPPLNSAVMPGTAEASQPPGSWGVIPFVVVENGQVWGGRRVGHSVGLLHAFSQKRRSRAVSFSAWCGTAAAAWRVAQVMNRWSGASAVRKKGLGASSVRRRCHAKRAKWGSIQPGQHDRCFRRGGRR